MAGPPPACNFGGVYPPGAYVFALTWYVHWPITYDESAAIDQLPTVLINIAHAGGAVINITFRSVDGTVIPTDDCGNPIVVSPPPSVPPITLTPPTCPTGYTFNPTTEMCDLGPIIIPGPGGGGSGGSGGGGSGGGTTPPPPTPSCPTGFHWDTTLEMCVADPLPIVLPPPSGDYNDEFQDCCQETLIALEAIREAIVALKPISGGAPTDGEECCIKVVDAIDLAANAIIALAKIVEAKNVNVNVALDLTPLVDAVAALKGSLDALPNEMSADTTSVVTALDGIKSAIPGPDPNLKRIADALEGMADPSDPDGDAFVDEMVARGALDAVLGGIIKGQT